MIRASNIHRFRNCSGAPAAEAGIPEREAKSWTEDGTLIHAALESAEASPAVQRAGAYVEIHEIEEIEITSESV
jgi:hypothetical protein